MATAKRKPTAKRSVKYATKALNTSAHATAQAASAGARAAANPWANKAAADWQKGASEWAKQSAKLYQFPFNQGEAADVAKNAAESVKSATENMVKMSSDMMQQLFSQTKKSSFKPESFSAAALFPELLKHVPQGVNFDPAAAQEKLKTIAREAAEQISKTAGNTNRALNEAAILGRENTQAAIEVSNIAVTVSKELAAELISYTNKLFSQNVELSKQILTCRTLNDMFDLATRITKTNLEGFFTESVKISEMAFQCATDVSEPLNERVSETTERLTKAISA